MSPRAALLVALAACSVGCSEEPEGPSPAVIEDIDRLRLTMIEDPAQQVLAEVDRVADDRPVLASQLLRTGGIPAARRQVAAVERVRVDTEIGRRTQRELRAAYDARLSALQDYERVLAAAASDDEALLHALHAMSEADRQLLAVHDAMEALSPTGPAPRRVPDEQGDGQGASEEEEAPPRR